jgi:hypothetical protein
VTVKAADARVCQGTRVPPDSKSHWGSITEGGQTVLESST